MIEGTVQYMSELDKHTVDYHMDIHCGGQLYVTYACAANYHCLDQSHSRQADLPYSLELQVHMRGE